MCLYGDDEKLIRIAAMELGITLTAFIRRALELYLRVLAMEKQSRYIVDIDTLTLNAILLVENITILATQSRPFPTLRELNCSHWSLDSYW